MNKQIQNQPSRDVLLSDRSSSVEAQIAWYHQMQETQPVHYRPEYNMWEIFRYKDVEQVLLDHATFSVVGSQIEGFPTAFGKYDPPRHRQIRGLVSKAFTPRHIEELTPRLIKIVDELLEFTIDKGKMDVVTDLTYPLPVRVIAEILGLPPQDQERVRHWSYQLLRHLLGVSKPDHSELMRYFSDLLNERERDPRDDLISGLLAAEKNGADVTREEMINLCLELMFAGNVTTTILLTYALQHFCQHPEIYQALRADPTLIPGAIEETLRYAFARINVWRVASHDTVLGGHEIKAGQKVVAWSGAANFDETYFPHSEQFDIRRSPNLHLAFGHGVHVCLGYPLARLEGRIGLERIVAHFSEIRLDPESPVQFMEQMGSSQLIESLGILFTPAGSSAS